MTNQVNSTCAQSSKQGNSDGERIFLNVDLLKSVNVIIMGKNTELGKMYWCIVYGFKLFLFRSTYGAPGANHNLFSV